MKTGHNDINTQAREDDRDDGGMEKRQHPRKPFRLSVRLTCDQMTGQKQARDISLSGIFVEGVEDIAPGKVVQLSLPFSNQEGGIKMKGKVVRVTRDGIGVLFDIHSIDMEKPAAAEQDNSGKDGKEKAE